MNKHQSSFYFANGFPHQRRDFNAGELSLSVDKWGGLDSLHLLDIFEMDGHSFPDRLATPPFFSKENRFCNNRHLYGPAITFSSTVIQNGKPGRRHIYFPQKTQIYPFGFQSTSDHYDCHQEYDLVMDDKCVALRFFDDSTTKETFHIHFQKSHIVSGKIRTMKNQVVEQFWGSDAYRGEDFDATKPFKDNFEADLAWEDIGFNDKHACFQMKGRLNFSYGDKECYLVILCNTPLAFEERKEHYRLFAPWGTSNEMKVAIAVGSNFAEVLKKAENGIASNNDVFEKKALLMSKTKTESPTIHIDSMPEAELFAKVIAEYEHNMVFEEKADIACLRAATHKFGFFAMWDQICPVKAFLATGDYATSKKLITYMLQYPHMKSCFWTTTLLINMIAEYYAYTEDSDFLHHNFPQLKEFFLEAVKHTCTENGLLELPMCAGADFPEELGFNDLFWPSCINGWWYDACRAIQHMAIVVGDVEVPEKARAIANQIEASYMDIFYDEDKGYLHVAIDPETGNNSGVYQNVASFAMDFPYGEYLFRQRIVELADYQANMLYHPAGRISISFDDDCHEMWKNLRMLQHLGHETKLARAAGINSESERLTANYLTLFADASIAIETHNICSVMGNETQTANWQTFSASAAYDAIIGGCLGVQWHMGGLFYTPGESDQNMHLNRFKFKNSTWDICISKSGCWPESLTIDGLELKGSLQIPDTYFHDAGTHKLEIIRTKNTPTAITLLYVLNLKIAAITSTPESLSFHALNNACTIIKAYSNRPVQLRVNTQEFSMEFDAEKKIVWAQVSVKEGDTIQLSNIIKKEFEA